MSIGLAEPETAAFLNWLAQVEPAVRTGRHRMFPGLADDVPLRIKPLHVNASHFMALVEAKDGSGPSLVVKGDRKHSRVWQSLEPESDVLTNIAPRIWPDRAAARCPKVLAFFPEQQALVLERIAGERLSDMLCGFAKSSSAPAIAGLVSLCGQWLAEFHQSTRSLRTGNPFEWLMGAFESDGVKRVFQKYASRGLYHVIRQLLRNYLENFSDFQPSLCMVHGDFAPYHVLVNSGRIYVIDLGSCHLGYRYEDLASFTRYYDALLPWRSVAAKRWFSLDQQKRTFLGAYASHEEPLNEPESILMRFARMHKIAASLALLLAPGHTLREALYSRVAVASLAPRLEAICNQEIRALRELHQPRSCSSDWLLSSGMRS
jgi:tRNA A-37 threonylcarbamoyl transferase component Bud32